MDAIIISDIHLGAYNCQGRLLVEFLEKIHNQEITIKHLILNGDIFDNFDLRLTKWHWKILSTIRSISDIVEVIYIKGNHDAYGPAYSIAHLIGAEYKEEYIFVSGGKKILCIHGDQFDNFIAEHPIMTRCSDWIYWLLQTIDNSFYLAKLAKRSSKTFLRCAEKVKTMAIKMARHKKCDIVCAGHVHYPDVFKDLDVLYLNSGSWTELPCSYITIDNGKANLSHYG